MTWIILALLAAVTEGALVVERKRLVNNTTPYQLAMIQAAVGATLFGAALPFFWINRVSGLLWGLILFRSLCEALAMVLLFVALERDDASRVMPITALTPLFIVLIEFLLTGRVPTVPGLLGIATIVGGAFFLMRGVKHETGLYLSPGMLPMLLVTLLWSMTGVIHTMVTRQTGAGFYLGTCHILMFLLLLAYGCLWRRIPLRELARLPERGQLGIGLLASASLGVQMFAQSLAPLASYVLALKRTSLIFGMLGSQWVLKEKIQQRIAPTVALTLGVILVLLFG